MNFAIILSGGVGARMQTGSIPKQYLEVDGKPILIYTLEQFEKCVDVDKIIVVASCEWQNKIMDWVNKFNISKFVLFADSGKTRQHSVINGLRACVSLSDTIRDNVTIHDAARPMVSSFLISETLTALSDNDGCMPTLPITDTVYVSSDGQQVTGLLDRKTLVAGQSPESFLLCKYWNINKDLTEQEICELTGSSEIAFRNGFNIKIIKGEESNFKLTTIRDLERFKKFKERQF